MNTARRRADALRAMFYASVPFTRFIYHAEDADDAFADLPSPSCLPLIFVMPIIELREWRHNDGRRDNDVNIETGVDVAAHAAAFSFRRFHVLPPLLPYDAAAE